MDAIKAIMTRQSVRQFNDNDVSDGQIRELLEAAMSAPTAYNRQPWQFIVITSREVLRQLASTGHYAAAHNAAAAILVCGDMEKEDGKFLMQSCSTAIENILIAAHAIGLGAVWTSIYPFEGAMDLFRDTFKLPENIIPITLVPIGYPSDSRIKERSSRFDKNKVHYNKW